MHFRPTPKGDRKKKSAGGEKSNPANGAAARRAEASQLGPRISPLRLVRFWPETFSGSARPHTAGGFFRERPASGFQIPNAARCRCRIGSIAVGWPIACPATPCLALEEQLRCAHGQPRRSPLFAPATMQGISTAQAGQPLQSYPCRRGRRTQPADCPCGTRMDLAPNSPSHQRHG